VFRGVRRSRYWVRVAPQAFCLLLDLPSKTPSLLFLSCCLQYFTQGKWVAKQIRKLSAVKKGVTG
jgi:hypothetical protein